MGIFKKYYVYIIIIFLFSGYTYYIYNKGRVDCQNRINKVIIQEQERFNKELEKLYNEGNRVKDKIREKQVLTDDEATCILSNNPFKKRCL